MLASVVALLALLAVWTVSSGGGKTSTNGKGQKGPDPVASITPGPSGTGPAISQAPGGRAESGGGAGKNGEPGGTAGTGTGSGSGSGGGGAGAGGARAGPPPPPTAARPSPITRGGRAAASTPAAAKNRGSPVRRPW
ncbi:hypothetical protein ACFXA3_27035, partial [Streptomyces sp. NPDC059456]